MGNTHRTRRMEEARKIVDKRNNRIPERTIRCVTISKTKISNSGQTLILDFLEIDGPFFANIDPTIDKSISKKYYPGLIIDVVFKREIILLSDLDLHKRISGKDIGFVNRIVTIRIRKKYMSYNNSNNDKLIKELRKYYFTKIKNDLIIDEMCLKRIRQPFLEKFNGKIYFRFFGEEKKYWTDWDFKSSELFYKLSFDDTSSDSRVNIEFVEGSYNLITKITLTKDNTII